MNILYKSEGRGKMNKKLVKEKIEINNVENFSKLEKLMYPVKKYVSEKNDMECTMIITNTKIR